MSDPWFWAYVALVAGAVFGWVCRGAHEAAMRERTGGGK